MPTSQPQTAALSHAIDQIAVGSHHAECDLFNQYLNPLRHYALSLTRNTASADDLTQETLRVVLEKLRAGGLRESSKFWPFLKGTARNLFLYERRKFKRRNTWNVAEVPEQADEAAEPLHDLLSAETKDLVQGLLQKLTKPRDREVLERLYLRDESSESVSRELGLPREHLHRVVFRARRRLKKLALESPEARTRLTQAA